MTRIHFVKPSPSGSAYQDHWWSGWSGRSGINWYHQQVNMELSESLHGLWGISLAPSNVGTYLGVRGPAKYYMNLM